MTKAYKAAWESEFQNSQLKASPTGRTSAELACRAEAGEAEFFKHYYDDAVLNRLANTVWGGMVFGEKTMLEMKAECCDEAQLIEAVNEVL